MAALGRRAFQGCEGVLAVLSGGAPSVVPFVLSAASSVVVARWGQMRRKVPAA